MGIQTQSALIAAILLLALALNVGLQERRVEHRWSFVGLLTALFFYNFCIFLHDVTGGGFWTRMLMLSGVGVAQASRRFFDRYLAGTPTSRTRLPVRTVVDGGSAAAVVLVLTRLGESTFLGVWVAGLAMLAYGHGIWRLYERYRQAETRVEVRRLSYLVLGGGVSVGLSTLDLLAAAGSPVPAFGHLFTTVYMYFWMQVVQRSRLLDLKELLGRGLALIAQSLATSAVYVGLLLWAADQPGLFLFNILLASVVLFFTFEPLKRLVDLWIGRLLFRDTFELEVQLTQLRRELAHVISLGDLADRVLDRLQASRRVTHASVFLLEEGGKAFYAPRSVGPSEVTRLHLVKGRALLDALQRERVVSLEQVEQKLRDLEDDPAATAEAERLQAMRATLTSLQAGLAFAVIARDRLVAFLTVQDVRTREAFSSNEIALIAGITAQITTVVENSELVQRLKERDRLQVMGEMAAGMAHEIRNPLGAIKAAGQLLEPEDMDEEQREFVEVIIEECDRLDSVLSQFLDYARPYRGSLEAVELQPVLERVSTLLKADAPGVAVAIELAEGLPAVEGDADHLLQVLLNLARNAVDAMEGKGRLILRAGLVREDGDGRVEVQVVDTGPGIPPEARDHLFVPFFTTKRKGTGLGLAICQRILQHHQSAIHVDSEAGRGTTMSFRLPRAVEAHRLSGEHRRRLDMEAPLMVRIIAGRARGLTLQVPEGQRVRPTADRVREALFNVLAHRLHVDFTGLRILDLFAGAGTLGLEALSRGAAELTAVEADAGVARVLTANARRLGAVRVVRQEAARFLAEATDAWDVVFLDPPYHKGLIAPVLAALAAGRLAPDGLAVVEHPADEAMYAPEPLGIRFQRIYGGTGITILGAPPPST